MIDLEAIARNAIIEIAIKNNWYFVNHYGHFGHYFAAIRNIRQLKPDIYDAIYEQYYDVISHDQEIFRIRLSDATSWQKILIKVGTKIPVQFKKDKTYERTNWNIWVHS